MTLTDKHPFWRLSESDRAAIISQARSLAQKLELPPEAHDEVVELVRQCAVRLVMQDDVKERIA